MQNWPPVERIELPGGAWWEIYSVCTRGMRKAFRHAGVRAFAGSLDGEVGPLGDLEALRRLLLAHPEKWDMDAVDDAYLLHGSHAYSYGDRVDLVLIDALDDRVVERVLARMRELYAEVPEGARKNS